MHYYPKRFKNKEEYLAYRREYYRNNKEKWKEWQKRDKDKIKKRHRKYARKKCYLGNGIMAMQRDNYTCQICFQDLLSISLNTVNKIRPAIHHKDGNGSTKPIEEQNNKLSNLVTLCEVCHGKLHAGKVDLICK